MKLIQHFKVTDPGGEVEAVTVDARDFMAFDVARARRGWPAAQEAGFLLMQFVCWNALKRAGSDLVTSGFDIEAPPFADIVELEGTDPDPTRTAPGPA